MRFLGFLFVIILLVGVVGFFRGWFSVTTTHAGAKGAVTLGVDKDMISDDARAAAAGLGELSAKAAEKVKALGRTVSTDETELEGTVTAVDPPARDLTVTSNSQTIDFHVATDVSITRDGETVGFEQLGLTTRARFFFKHIGDDRRLSRIQILR